MHKRRKRNRTPGRPPGSLIREVGEFVEYANLDFFIYDENELEERNIESLEQLPSVTPDKTLWLNIPGLKDAELLKEIGERFDLHPLLLEDILNPEQRPKLDEFDNCLALTLRMMYVREEGPQLEDEQITLVLGSGFVLSFQEKPGDVFDPIRERLRRASGRIRHRKSDYLLYALTDLAIDHYFVLIEALGDKVEDLEELVFSNPSENNLESIHQLKRELLIFRRSTFPLREAISQLQRLETGLITQETQRFITDAYDHIINILDLLENYRELNTGLKDIYLSSLSLRMNKVIQLLTIISTIFIPLTFIVGIYGMNFENMPELDWEYGYFLILGIMAAIVLGMVVFFKTRKWL